MRRMELRCLPGAFAKPRRLQVQKSKDGLYFCPTDFCDHNGFLSQRGCRKHTKTKHGWYFYFDNKPKFGDDPIKTKSKEFWLPDRRPKQQKIPSFSTSTVVAVEFQHWLESTAGGGKAKSQAAQVCSRAMKFLRLYFEENSDDDNATMQMVDYCLGSADLICQFLDVMENDWKLGHSGRLSLWTFESLVDLLVMFLAILPSLISISRGQNVLSQGESRGLKITMWTLWKAKEIGLPPKNFKLIPFHKVYIEDILSRCKESPSSILSSELTFATRYLPVFLIIEVKGTRPMTYQYLTVDMCEKRSPMDGLLIKHYSKQPKRMGLIHLFSKTRA